MGARSCDTRHGLLPCATGSRPAPRGDRLRLPFCVARAPGARAAMHGIGQVHRQLGQSVGPLAGAARRTIMPWHCQCHCHCPLPNLHVYPQLAWHASNLYARPFTTPAVFARVRNARAPHVRRSAPSRPRPRSSPTTPGTRTRCRSTATWTPCRRPASTPGGLARTPRCTTSTRRATTAPRCAVAARGRLDTTSEGRGLESRRGRGRGLHGGRWQGKVRHARMVQDGPAVCGAGPIRHRE